MAGRTASKNVNWIQALRAGAAALILLGSLLAPAPASAQPAARDVDFGNGGIAELDLEGVQVITDSAVQPDGKVLVAFYTVPDRRSSESRASIARLNVDGTPDVRFGVDGVLDLGPPVEERLTRSGAVEVTDDGHILVAIQFQYPRFERWLMRLESDGTLDSSFGVNGVTGQSEITIVEDIVALEDGGVLTLSNNGSTDMLIHRYLEDGELDPNFGESGIAQVARQDMAVRPEAMVVLSNGSIASAGRIYPWKQTDDGLETDSDAADVFVSMHTADGQLIEDFGDAGLHIYDHFESDFGTSIVEGDRNNVVVTGWSTEPPQPDRVERRIFAYSVHRGTGEPTSGFGNDGVTEWPNSLSTFSWSSVVQQNGKIAIAGSEGPRFLRINADGSPDLNVGSTGESPALASGVGGDHMALAPDGKLVIAFSNLSNINVVRVLGDPVEVEPEPEPPVATCNGLEVTVDLANGDKPTSGDDVILGTNNVDRIKASGGNDTICALGGDDIIKAGKGDDWVDAGDGDDRVIGGGGKDQIRGGNGSDFIKGGQGNDVLKGGADDDTIDGGKGADRINGGLGTDSCDGGRGKNKLRRC